MAHAQRAPQVLVFYIMPIYLAIAAIAKMPKLKYGLENVTAYGYSLINPTIASQ
ncbi:hypothetical protein H6F42_09610 [Pseudanabaena sp. FACHB-1998]|nr:hypothetical protein [Pseudanabaena sp. FACHB-1998]